MKKKKQQLQFKKILGYYWMHTREHKGALFLLMLFYTIGIALAEGVMPLIAKDIIDTMSTFDVSRDSVDDVWRIFIYFVLVTIGYNVFFRAGDYLIVAFEAKVLRRLTHMV